MPRSESAQLDELKAAIGTFELMVIPSLFLLPYGSNSGFAIGRTELLFFQAGLTLAGGNAKHVHIGYPNLERGYPEVLPKSFSNVVCLDFTRPSYDNLRCIADYVEEHQIKIVVIFDIQPRHPLHRLLRKAGAIAILAYWGAEISPIVPLWKLFLRKLEMKFSRSRVDGLIFQSQAMAFLGTHGRGVPAHMIDLVPPGVDMNAFKPGASTYVYDVLGLPSDRKVVVYAGHIYRRKGIHTLIAAAITVLIDRQRDDVCFLLLGNRENESAEYERMYTGLGIDTLIRFGGYREDLAQIYPGCFCGVIPTSGWESFTRASVEMAACGLPIIASRLQGLKEAVIDGTTGLLFEPENSLELANKLELLLENQQLAREYGQRGRARCEQEFSFDIHRERFTTVLRRRFAEAATHLNRA